MTNIQSDDEDSLYTVVTFVLVGILFAVALLVPSPPEELPATEVEKPQGAIIKTVYAEPLPEPVATPEQVVEEVVSRSITELADAIIECESSGRNVEIIDTNGKWSRGIAQFQDATWEWMSQDAGVVGSSTEPEKAREVLLWALENGHGRHWTCYRKLTNNW